MEKGDYVEVIVDVQVHLISSRLRLLMTWGRCCSLGATMQDSRQSDPYLFKEIRVSFS